jgi:hypothetical protein
MSPLKNLTPLIRAFETAASDEDTRLKIKLTREPLFFIPEYIINSFQLCLVLIKGKQNKMCPCYRYTVEGKLLIPKPQNTVPGYPKLGSFTFEQ